MSRFLFTVWPLRSHLNPFMCVAQSLRQRGHEVAFYTGAAVTSIVLQQGFRCFTFDAVNDSRVERNFRKLTSRNLNPNAWREVVLGTVPDQLRDLDTLWPQWEPEAIVCDMAMWGPILVTHEVREIPVAVLSHVAACLLPGRESRLPGMGWMLRAARARPLAGIVASLLRMGSAGVPRAANELRRSWGLPAMRGTVTEFTAQLPLYLVPGTPDFDGLRNDLPPSVSYVGPCLWDKNREQARPEWIGRISRDCPCVIVTEGSMYPEEPIILRAAAKGLANRNCSVILLAGEGRSLEKLNLSSLAPNVRLEQGIPLSDILPIADVVVTNGDSETVMTALHHSLPMVLAPAILDQPEISWRVLAMGAGLRLRLRSCSPERLATAVETVLADKRFRERAALLAESFTEYSGGEKAAVLLEKLAFGSVGTSARMA